MRALCFVRPAWAHTCGCKSRCELVTVSKVKRNCVRVTERGKEAWSINREPMNKNRIEGVAKQGEWAKNRKALVTKAGWRRCGGCAMKVCVSVRRTPAHPQVSADSLPSQLPAVWQQLFNPPVGPGWQLLHHVLQVRVRVVTVEFGRLDQTHHRCRPLARSE